MRVALFAIVGASVLLIGACSSDSTATDSTASTSTTSSTTTISSPPLSVLTPTPNAATLVSFPDPASVDAWTNVDDSVMGGVSASESTWLSNGGAGALVFSGVLSTESNGGFSSTLGPLNRRIGELSANARGLRIISIGDGRTYLLQLRAGSDGNERWIARFTPQPSGAANRGELIPFGAFEAVNRFLRPVTPAAPLNPSTIIQVGVYVLDAQVGEFRLVLESINAEN